MSASKEKDRFAEHRVVFKVPEYMSELREELMTLPENLWSKRILQLALIGLTITKMGGATAPQMATTTSKGAGKTKSVPTKSAPQQSAVEPAQTLAPAPAPVTVPAEAPQKAVVVTSAPPSPIEEMEEVPVIIHDIQEPTPVSVQEEVKAVAPRTEKSPPRRNRLPAMPVMTQ